MQFSTDSGIWNEDWSSGSVRLTLDLDAPPGQSTGNSVLQGHVALLCSQLQARREVWTLGGYVNHFLDSLGRLRRREAEVAILYDASELREEALRVSYRVNHHPFYLMSAYWPYSEAGRMPLRAGEFDPRLPADEPNAGFYCALLGLRIEDEQLLNLIGYVEELLQVTGVSLADSW